MLYLIPLYDIPKIIFNLLCHIPLYPILLYTIPKLCYTRFRYTSFCYTWFLIFVITDSVIPNSVITDSFLGYTRFRYTQLCYTWFHFGMLYLIPLYQVPCTRSIGPRDEFGYSLASPNTVLSLHLSMVNWFYNITTKQMKIISRCCG